MVKPIKKTYYDVSGSIIGENCLIPDIRPKNIETITESYTPSGGVMRKLLLIKS